MNPYTYLYRCHRCYVVVGRGAKLPDMKDLKCPVCGWTGIFEYAGSIRP